MEVTEVRQEVERRHQLAIQQSEVATNMQMHSTEQRAQQRHEEIVANLENRIPQTEFQASARDQRLLTELSERQARLSQESAEARKPRMEIIAMQSAYARELEMQIRMVAD